ncbi:hypothetical protein IG631_21651 [Alternaria alternata]|nr:hypothetical protein IG631_21651 [Alternaria alternata]
MPCSGAAVAFTGKVWRCGVRVVKGARDLGLQVVLNNAVPIAKLHDMNTVKTRVK